MTLFESGFGGWTHELIFDSRIFLDTTQLKVFTSLQNNFKTLGNGFITIPRMMGTSNYFTKIIADVFPFLC